MFSQIIGNYKFEISQNPYDKCFYNYVYAVDGDYLMETEGGFATEAEAREAMNEAIKIYTKAVA